MSLDKAFWEIKTLAEMTPQEQELLCDGCGRCCLQKLEDDESGETFFTRVACRLLDIPTCRCMNYPQRFDKVSDCAQVLPMTDQKRHWLPYDCAYLRHERGEGLASWHPLITGSSASVHEAGVSIVEWAISEEYVAPELYEELIIDIDSL